MGREAKVGRSTRVEVLKFAGRGEREPDTPGRGVKVGRGVGVSLRGGVGEGVQVGSMVMRETGVAGRIAGDDVKVGAGVDAGVQAANKNNSGRKDKIRTLIRWMYL